MTPLKTRLLRRIAAAGPITIAEYMAECLLDPEHGYYATRPAFGASGDFITAPEISQMFGELLGLWLAQAWLDQGAPDPFCLAEFGPGRGTLMADALRAAAGVPRFGAAARVHLVEASRRLRAEQAIRVPDAIWFDHAGDLPDLPLFVLANEFFDALPVRQFRREAGGWSERLVTASDGALAFASAPPTRLALLDHRWEDTGPGDIVETCEPASGITAELARRIAARGGVALIVDYGGWRSLGDTLQAMAGHAPCDPLDRPGQADLTAHVDFEALARAAKPDCAVAGPVGQGTLLERLGITMRARQLAQSLSGAALDAHVAAHRRLTHPREMGTLFKAIALHARPVPVPPGFRE